MTSLLLLASVGLVGLTATATSASADPVAAAGTYTAVNPTRVLDTRIGLGAPSRPVAANQAIALQVTGGVVPAGLSAVVLNVTVTAPTSTGYITVYPDGTPRPTVSNLNFTKDQTVPNLVTVKVAGNGRIDLFNGSGGTVQLVADVSGYYTGGTPTDAGTFVALDPARVLDTRIAVGARGGPLAARSTMALQVGGRGGVAPDAAAVVLNVTVTQTTSSGYLTVYPDASRRPASSSLNFTQGVTVPNLVIVPLAPDGMVDLYNGSGGQLQVVADVAGYFLAGDPVDTGAFHPLSPVRVLDTRSSDPGGPVAANQPWVLPLADLVGIPDATGVAAVVMNLTETQPTSTGYATAYPDETPRPNASNLNFRNGQTVPNLSVVRMGADGKVDLYNGSGGTVQFVADVAGYFTGSPAEATTVGTIAGTVSDPTGHQVGALQVVAYSVVNGALSGDNRSYVAIDGSYSISDVPISSAGYVVCVYDGVLVQGRPSTGRPPTGFVDACYGTGPWNFMSVPVGAVRVPVASRATTRVNFTLTIGGAISGTATNADDVVVYDANGRLIKLVAADPDGSYFVMGLPPSTGYLVCMQKGSGANVQGKCYPNIPWTSVSAAALVGTTKIPIRAGVLVPNINLTL